MRRYGLWAVFLLAGCAKGADADLPFVSKARSLVAEWALISQQEAADRVSPTYAHAMREQIRTDLQLIPPELGDRGAPYATAIAAAAALPESADPARLRAIANALKRQEDALESA